MIEAPMTLYLATTNRGKLRDFAAASNDAVALTPLPNLNAIPAPEENQPTFEGNARLKAVYYSLHLPGEIVLADDSGLEVDALHGAPGVRSARYADDYNFAAPGTTDQRNNLCLQRTLAKLPRPHTARYRCVLAAARDGQILCTAAGAVEGKIISTPRGAEGFGYDPLFYLRHLKKTMAELDIATKFAFSHRGRAFAVLLDKLRNQIEAVQIQRQST